MATFQGCSLCHLVLIMIFAGVNCCGGGSSSCTYKTCSATYGAYTPAPAYGRCRSQTSYVTHHYKSHTKSSGCPSSSSCTQGNRKRVLCRCMQVTHCSWASWGAWTGSLHPGKCVKQRRYRNAQKSFQYTDRVNNCQGISSECYVKVQTDLRTICSCRKAESCPPSPWTSWAPVVNNGKCTAQQRHQDKIPKYKYVKQLTNCYGINPSCPARVTDYRTLCSCEYKECVQGSWTAWEIHSWAGDCPTEKRFQQYRAITKYKHKFGDCKGVGPQTCPNPKNHIRQKVVSCPKLDVPPNSVHVNPACDGVNSNCKATCQINCKKGFYLEGVRYVTCNGNGKWSSNQGICKDKDPPLITCPTVGQFNNTHNEDYTIVDLLDATATDNSGAVPNITVSRNSPVKVKVGKPLDVIYTATDDSGNKASCKITIAVTDTEPPKVVSCPEDKVFQTAKFPHAVFWEKPKFLDNVDGTNVNTYPSHQNGAPLTQGSHTITYLAKDQSFNEIKCTFKVQVDPMACKLYKPPKHGSSTCNIRKNGVTQTHVCTVACKKGHWFIKGPNIPVLYNYYICRNAQWQGQNVFDPMSTVFFASIPEGKTPWPDCAVGNVPNEVSMDFQVFGGNCKDAAAMDKLKQDFIAALQKDVILNNLFCQTSVKEHCVVQNFVVQCASRKRRSTGTNVNQVVITFTLAIRDTATVGKTNTAVLNKLKSLLSSLNAQKSTLINMVKKSAPTILNDQGTSINAKNANIACQVGYEYKVIDGVGLMDDRIKCLKCPRGTYFEESTKKCTVCQTGHYQELEAQVTCKKCPAGTSTFGDLARDFHECKGICQPGTSSTTGLETCIACPISTYQPAQNSTSCILCPSGTATPSVGSYSIDACAEPGAEIEIHSEGCRDPNIAAGTCGKSTIKVNGKDLSQHQRGVNLVALDSYTAHLVQSVSFDWHGDYDSCRKTLLWVNNLKDDVIVLVAAQDEMTGAQRSVCQSALEVIGGKRPFQNEYRSSFAMIGYKGKHKVSWVQQKKSAYGRGPTNLKESIQLMSIFVSITSEGCNDPNRQAPCGIATIVVDGEDRSLHQRGYNFVVLDGLSGHFIEARSFDTHGKNTACQDQYNWISNLKDEVIVLAAIQDEAAHRANETCFKALDLIGGKRPYQKGYRGSFVLFGYKGKRSVSWIQQKQALRGKGPTKLQASIK